MLLLRPFIDFRLFSREREREEVSFLIFWTWGVWFPFWNWIPVCLKWRSSPSLELTFGILIGFENFWKHVLVSWGFFFFRWDLLISQGQCRFSFEIWVYLFLPFHVFFFKSLSSVLVRGSSFEIRDECRISYSRGKLLKPYATWLLY